jgi:tRNA pseudouridine65 synthase
VRKPALYLTVLYQDEHYVVINKPPGLLMHRSPISRDRVVVLQTLRDQLGRLVYPAHRLDRATSGVLAFGLSPDAARQLGRAFEARKVTKRYLAVARGWTAAKGYVDHPMKDDEDNGVEQPAQTCYQRLATVELPFAVDRYPTSRYSLVCAEPLTGRRQQLRRHFKHISHHLIGDTTHGSGKHNQFFRQHIGIHRLLLLAYRLSFAHPFSAERIDVTATLDAEWQRVASLFATSTDQLDTACGQIQDHCDSP